MNESLVKYLAGLLDADGSLSFTFKDDEYRQGRHYVGLSLRLGSSIAVDRKNFIETLPTLTGMGIAARYGSTGQFKSWTVRKRADLEKILPRLIKHMVIKARHWQWMLEQWRNLRANATTVSDEDAEALRAASKESRQSRVGPIRPKSHPTWAWLAGYLDGDGWYSYRRGRQGGGHERWAMEVGAVAHVNDGHVLEFLHRSFGGAVREHGQSHVKKWVRSLGYQNRSFVERFLPHLAKHSRLKREKIEAVIHHHRQRLSVPGVERQYCTVDGCDRPRREWPM